MPNATRTSAAVAQLARSWRRALALTMFTALWGCAEEPARQLEDAGAEVTRDTGAAETDSSLADGNELADGQELADGRLADAGSPADGQNAADATAAVDAAIPDGSPGAGSPFDNLVPPGFPNSTNTGLLTPASQLKVHNGTYVTNKDGQLVEGLFITGDLYVKHANVTVRNCRIIGINFWSITLRQPGAMIEDCELGREAAYVKLTSPVSPGDTKLQLDQIVPVGAYLLLSSTPGAFVQTLRVKSVTGAGPYSVTVERHYSDKGVSKVGPPTILSAHPAGAALSIYDPSTGPLPENGISANTASPINYTVRRCDIHHVSDGMKVGEGTYEDNYIHELFYVPPAHLDSVQSMGGTGAVLRHNSFVSPYEANGIQLAPNQAPLRDMTFEYNYVDGGGWALRWGVYGGEVRHNRFGRGFGFGPLVIYNGGKIGQSRDNRFADDGSVVPTVPDPTFGDRDGDGTGAGDAWGTGHDPKYKLPGN